MTYRSEIDGLRAIAVMSVIMFHAGFETFSGGYAGVDVFFVISGYLITSICLNDLENNKFDLLIFYERRARRILPALFFIIICCVIISWKLLPPRDMKEFSLSVIAVSTFSSNILFWRGSGYFDTAADLKPLLHTWSLAVEEQFYIIFPLFLTITWKFGRRVIVWTLVVAFLTSLALAHWGAYNKPTATFFLLPTRAWELLIGSFSAFYLHRKGPSTPIWLSNPMSVVGLAAIMYTVFAFDDKTPFPSLYSLAPTVGTVLIILFSVKGTWIHKLLSLRPIVGIGLISYSLYLWHQPVFVFWRHYNILDPTHIQLLFLCIICIILATITYFFVEMPFRRKYFWLNRIQIFQFSSATIAAFCFIGFIGWHNDGFRNRYPNEVQEILDTEENWIDRSDCAFHGSAIFHSNISRCFDHKTVLLIGDSHAQSISLAIRRHLDNLGYKLVSLTHSACFPIHGTFRLPVSSDKNCANFKDKIADIIKNSDSVIIFSARWRLNLEGNRFDNLEGGVESGDSAQNFILKNGTISKDLRDFVIDYLTKLASERPIIIIDQIPEAGWNVKNLVIKTSLSRGKSSDEISTSYQRYREANQQVNRIMNTLDRVATIVRTDRIVCSDITGRCRNTLGGMPLYRDDDHPSLIFAELIAEETVRLMLDAGIISE